MKQFIAQVTGMLALASLAAAQEPTPRAALAEPLRRWLTAFAHDTMLGRRTGTAAYAQATRYLAGEAAALGLAPAGVQGGYEQPLPLTLWQLDLAGAEFKPAYAQDKVSVQNHGGDVRSLTPGLAFVPLVGVFELGTPRSTRPRPERYPTMVFAGALGEGRSVDVPRSVVVLSPPRRADGEPEYQLWEYHEALYQYAGAEAILLTSIDLLPQGFIRRLTSPQFALRDRVVRTRNLPPIIAVSRGVSDFLTQYHLNERILQLAGAASFRYTSRELPLPAPVANVVARLEGSDPTLRNEYVVVSASADHLGLATDEDIVAGDSVFNGADAGGSGAVALLAVAQALAEGPVRPKRSVLFLWTAGAADGLLGSEHFADHPTVPRERIVAHVHVDRLGRAADGLIADDAGVLSSELAAWVTAAAAGTDVPLLGVRDRDRTTRPQCDGDHWHFTRQGIPSVRLTGLTHRAHRTVADDVAEIDFEAYAASVRTVTAVVADLADRPRGPRVDRERYDRASFCAW